MRATTVDSLVSGEMQGRVPRAILVDTEGNDAPVLFGAATTLATGLCEYVEFEYSDRGAWATTRLQQVVDYMGRFGFDCFWAGRKKLWRVTGCFDRSYEGE